MTIRFDCPNCKANYEVADDLANKMIMCRVCKKRGKVQNLPSQTPSGTTLPSVAKSTGTPMSRRNFLPIAGLVLASIGAIATGALLARQPWRKPPTDDFGPGRRRKGPPPGEDKKDDKGKGPSA
ncbi:MAG TPA: hypothetical protein VE999_08610 [Gemmataceae bacterium]|nr:hypothetical protein [Gemmataceae bacterium]